MAELIRLQDTRAAVAAKINRIFAGKGVRMFREVPQTREQWQLQLNAAVRALVADNYSGLDDVVFRLADTDTDWARKLHAVQASIAAGNV